MATFKHENFTMHYELHGEGDPVLCIMGITAPGEYWADHLECWAEKFHCITPDNRGVGFTDKPTGDYSSEMMAQDHINLLDHLGIDKVHIVGCSMGSIIAQQIALLAPSRVKSLTLMCTWARVDSYAKSIFNHILKAKAHLKSEELLEYLQLLIFDKRSWDDPEFYQSMLEAREDAKYSQYPQPLHGLSGQCAACVNHDTLEILDKVKLSRPIGLRLRMVPAVSSLLE